MHRVRRRYLALKIVSEKNIEKRELVNAVWEAIHQLFGEYGASKVRLKLIDYEKNRNRAILFCSHEAVEILRASISSIVKINEDKVAIHVIGVSGTLKSLRKKFFK